MPSLASGSRLGPYEVLSPLGVGGMGEVYRARDTRLQRTVAIKVIRPEASADAGRRARFEREARAVSSLNHPHIGALYDVGQEDGVDFLVMEYVEGETLAERLSDGPLSLEQTLKLGAQMAEALHAAHRQGIVHRDLKPGNVMLTKSGVKLLDFGLAKLRDEPSPTEGDLPTREKPLTSEGVVMGTVPYMAPEQLERQPADARTDIWALGAILHEMATGARAFTGGSQASLIAAILEHDPPPVSSLQPLSPPAFDRVVRTCLAKDPDERWQSAHDMARELRWSLEAGSSGALLPARTSPHWLTWAFAALTLAAGVLAIWAFSRRPAAEARPVVRFAVPLGPGERLATDSQTALALSPDGAQLAYSARRGDTTQLYLRALDGLETQPIPGTEGGEGPIFSPDGRWVAFFADHKIKKVALGGGATVVLAEASDPWGASWGPDDTIVYTPAGAGGLWTVPADGGTPRELTRPDPSKGDYEDDWPQALSRGRVLFTSWLGGSMEAARIAILSRDTGQRRALLEGGFHARYVPSGHLAYARRRALHAVPFDLERLQVNGPPAAVLPDVLVNLAGAAHFSLAAQGTLAYVPAGPGEVDRTLVWVDRAGTAVPALEARRSYVCLALAPDGRRVALMVEGDKTTDICVAELERGTLARLTLEEKTSQVPIWTPDGRRVVFNSLRGRTLDLYWQPADGSGPAEPLVANEFIKAPEAWTPDGRALVYGQIHPQNGWDLWLLPLDDRRPRPFLQTPNDEAEVAFSPDGRWLAYVSTESGRSEVYVQAYPGPGGKWQVSVGGGGQPRWSPDGKELVYRHGERVLSVPVDTRPSFRAGRPRLLFERRYEWGQLPGIRTFDIGPDGRFLMIKGSDAPPTQVNVVLNWVEELRRRVPSEKN